MKKLLFALSTLFLVLLLAGCPGDGGPRVTVNVPAAVKEIESKFACKQGLVKREYVHGNLDAFASPTDPANQSAAFDTWFASVGYSNPTLADYDGTSVDQWFGDTFTGLPSNIVEAYFITGLKPLGSKFGNDTLGLGDVSASIFGGSAISSLATNGWTTQQIPGNNGNNETIAARYLSSLGSVLAAMNSSHELDYWVQDDTSVDFAKLVICSRKEEKGFDLSIKKTLKGEMLQVGSVAQYNLYITNNGPSAAPGPIVVQDQLPTGLVWDNNSPANWSCSLQSSNPDVISCTFTGTLPLPANTSIALPLTVIVNEKAEKEVRNCAKVIAKGDINPKNDQDCITSSVKPGEGKFDLGIRKRLKGEVLVVGGTGQYDILIHNYGPNIAPGPIHVVDVLPTGIVWDNNSPANWNCSLQSTNPDTIFCNYTGSLPLAVNASINLPLTVSVNEKAGKEVRNCASVSAAGDINPKNDKSCVVNPVKPRARFDLESKKTLKGDVIRPGHKNYYIIQISNNGPDAAPGPITVTDTLPTGLVWDGNSPNNWSCSLTGSNPDVLTCSYTGSLPLASGDSINLYLTVNVNDKVGDVAKNCATVAATGDTNPKNDTGCVTSKVARKQAVDISTGSLNATTALNVGDADPDWQIISAPATNSYTGDSEVYVNPAWTATHAAHSEWISSPKNNHRGNGHYIFKRQFNIPTGMSNCLVNVSRYASDNSSKLDIKDTGGTVLHTESLTTNSHPDFQTGMAFNYTISTPATGVYSIEVNVNNISSVMGLLVEAKVTCNP